MKKNKNSPVKKNEEHTSKILDLTHEGLGVAKIDNYPIFIEGALPGEKVYFKIIKAGNKFGFGKLLDILEQSPDRVEVTEKVYTQTGTMPLQHLSYEGQLRFKKQQVINVLERIAKIPDAPVYDPIGMETPFAYRNKAQIPVRDIDGELTTGFFRKNSHDLIPLENFIIQDPKIDKAIVVVRDILRKYQTKPYDEKNHKGTIRHIVVRRGYYTGELMIVLVTRANDLQYEEEITEEIRTKLPDLVSLVQNINPDKTNVIFGKKSRILFGEDSYNDSLLGDNFTISHQSFYQVNPIQTEKLYQIAVDYAELTGNETVIDAYCGIGTLTLALAKKAKHVYGIEIVEPAIENAKLNAKQNQITNVSFEVAAAEKWMVNQANKGEKVEVVVVDPPRKGLDQEFIDAMLEIKPSRMVYVSCNPATLGRDLRLLSNGGYKVIKVQPVDMFPQTTHIEIIVLIKRADT